MPTITPGLDLGDRSPRYAVLDADAQLIGEGSVATTREAMQDFFAALPLARVNLEVGTHSPWVSRVVATGGHEVLVANPRRVRLLSAAVRKNDRIDAVTLARLGRADPALLSPIRHRGETAQADLGQLRGWKQVGEHEAGGHAGHLTHWPSHGSSKRVRWWRGDERAEV